MSVPDRPGHADSESCPLPQHSSEEPTATVWRQAHSNQSSSSSSSSASSPSSPFANAPSCNSSIASPPQATVFLSPQVPPTPPPTPVVPDALALHQHLATASNTPTSPLETFAYKLSIVQPPQDVKLGQQIVAQPQHSELLLQHQLQQLQQRQQHQQQALQAMQQSQPAMPPPQSANVVDSQHQPLQLQLHQQLLDHRTMQIPMQLHQQSNPQPDTNQQPATVQQQDVQREGGTDEDLDVESSRHNLTKSQLSAFFHLPITEAAKALGTFYGVSFCDLFRCMYYNAKKSM